MWKKNSCDELFLFQCFSENFGNVKVTAICQTTACGPPQQINQPENDINKEVLNQ